MDWLKDNSTNQTSGGFVEPGLKSDSGSDFKSSPEISVGEDDESVATQKAEIKQEMEEVREEREEKDKAVADQLIVIHGAKVKFNSHLGEFKVLSDVPTTQDKLTGTIVEKNIPNFTFYDGFTLNTLTMWQDFGTMKVQENEVLIKKSFNPGVGIMPGSSSPEPGKVEFVNSGQIHMPESIDMDGAPLPGQKEDETEYIYYTKEGYYLGGLEGSAKVFISTQAEYDKGKKDKKWSVVNIEDQLLKDESKEISNYDFNYINYIVKMESGDNDLKELKCIAFASHNRSVKGKKTWKALLATAYSSVPKKQSLKFSDNTSKSMNARKAVILVLTGAEDITKGAEYWDGTDFLAWGNSEQNPYNKLGQNKFDEYKFIEIPKDIYDTFLAASGSSARYGDKGKHDLKNDKGKHEHITKTAKTKILGKDGKPVLNKEGKPTFKKEEVPSKIKYKIPATEFEDEKNWSSGSFYYDTGVKVSTGISGTISAGKSIFWKLTSTRLTNANKPVAK